jgi:DNA-binding Lrp family transcriptional regulator
MHDQPNDPSPAEEMDRTDAAILRILLDDGLTAPLSEHELTLEVGDRVEVADSLTRLRGAGLIHRCGELTFPTAAARRFAALL